SELMPMGSFKIEMLYGSPDDNMFDSLAFVFLGFLSFFFTFIVAGMALVRERFSQTLERVFTTPVRRYQIVGGYMLGYGILTAVQGLLIILFAIYVLEVPLAGSLWLCILVMVLLAFTAVATGALVSIFANSEFQVVQFIPIVVIPQVFFTGLIPLETIPYGLGKLCYLMPVYYGCAPLKEIMIKGAGFSDIYFWLLGLLAYIALLFLLNVVSLKKYRKL
ncbi:MAG: ABC transporter permease, partial [Bacteroidales bacterium]